MDRPQGFFRFASTDCEPVPLVSATRCVIDMAPDPAGAFTVTVTDFEPLPYVPLQVIVKVSLPAAAGVTIVLPLVPTLLPDHAPLSLQLVAPVLDHVSVTLWPCVMVLAESVRLTVGAMPPPPPPPPPP